MNDIERRFIVEKAKLEAPKFDGFSIRIITDTETGVQYLFAMSGYGGGLTALLDADGKPLVDPSHGKNQYGF